MNALLDKLDRGLKVIEKSVDIGEQDSDVAACSEELGDFDGGDKVAAVRTASGGSTCMRREVY